MKKTIFTGGYTQTSKGIYICEFDDRSASVSIREIEEKCENPNFIAANWRKGFLCALNEDEANTWITLYRISDTKKLVLLDSIEVGGKGPCHISIDENGRRVFFANYESGDIGMVLIGENGKFSKNIKRVYHQGGSVSERQKSAHPHGVHILRREELAVPDLGLDQIRIYDISGYDMKLKDIVQVKTGDGPEHAVLHPNGKALYVICELQNVVYTFISEKEKWKEIQRVPLLPPCMAGEFIAGEVDVTGDGGWLLASVRAWGDKYNEDGYISVFHVENGEILKYVDTVGSGGSHPRMFQITDEGKYVFIANQYSNDLSVFTLNHLTGGLKKICSARIPEITCVICE